MDSPYADVYSQAAVVCSGGSYWSYFYFSMEPNLKPNRYVDGRDVYSSKIKWDNELTSIGLNKRSGEKFLYVNNEKSFIKNVRNKNNFMLKLDWYGNLGTIFKYSLKGSSKAIKNLEEKCGPAPVWHSEKKRAEIFREKREREKIDKLIRENLYDTEFKINHNKSKDFIKTTVTEILSSEGFMKESKHESIMIWSHPYQKRNRKINLDCGDTFWVKKWNMDNFSVNGMMIIKYSNQDIRLKYVAKGKTDYPRGPDMHHTCHSKGRLENIILSALADTQINIKPKK